MTNRNDEEAVRELIAAFAEGWNAGDGAGCARPFAEDADFTNIMGLKAHGRETIGHGHAEILATVFRGTKMTTQVESVRFLRPDVAVVDATLRLANADGTPFPMAKSSSAGYVATKGNGAWSIAVFRNMIPFTRPAAGPLEESLRRRPA